MISIFRDVSTHNKNGTYIVTISDNEGEVVPPIFGGVDLSYPGISERLNLNDAHNLAQDIERKLIEQYEENDK